MMTSMIQNTPLILWIGSPSCESNGLHLRRQAESTGALSERGMDAGQTTTCAQC